MVTDRTPFHDQFLEELRDLWRFCGSPTYPAMVEVSADLGKLYKRGELPRLSPSAISAVLSGKRDKVPSGAWVAAYVITCMHLGWKIGAYAEPPTESDLEEWHQKRFRACDRQETQSDKDDGTPDRPPDVPGQRAAAPAAETVADPELPLLSVDESAHVAEFAAGQLLLDGLENGDATACYQVAVLLAATYGRTETSHSLLRYAASDYHAEAAELLENSGALADPEALARHSELIAATTTDSRITILFRECAHACRNPPARPDPPAAG